MEDNQVGGQRLEAPGVPIVHTRLDRPEAFLHLTTFATRREGEGRVDNVILEVEPRVRNTLSAVPLVILKTKRQVKLQSTPEAAVLRLDNEQAPPFLLSDKSFSAAHQAVSGETLDATVDGISGERGNGEISKEQNPDCRPGAACDGESLPNG